MIRATLRLSLSLLTLGAALALWALVEGYDVSRLGRDA